MAHLKRISGRGTLRRLAGFGGLLGVLLAVTPVSSARAADPLKVVLGTTPLADVLPAYVAKEKGFFLKHGLDVSFTFIPINPTIPAALVSDSIQIGAPNAAVFVQSVDAGVPLQLVAGSTTSPSMGAGIAYLTRADVAYDGPMGLEGKTILMPGLGSSVDVLFRKWLADKGASEKKIKFIEMASAQTDDALKSRSVDGAVAVEPFLTRIQQTGNGKLAVRFMDGLAGGKLGISYVATRTWIEKNPVAVKGFREAIDEAIAWSQTNQQEARTIMQPYVKLPQTVIDALPFPNMDNGRTLDSISWWIDVMKSQGRIAGNVKPADMIAR